MGDNGLRTRDPALCTSVQCARPQPCDDLFVILRSRQRRSAFDRNPSSPRKTSAWQTRYFTK